MRFHFAALLMLTCAACDDKGTRTPSDTTATDTTATDTTATDTTATDTTATDTTATDTTATDTTVADTGGEVTAPPPNIAQALDCGAAPPAGPGNSNQLQRHELDTALFPDALCNDGSTAVFYYRPYVGEENKDRWLINLNGGGGCGSGQSCADRWCWCQSLDGAKGCPHAAATTNFSMENMNGDTRESMTGDGIFLRGDANHPNPMGNWNQIRVVYCSSDAWAGTRRDVPLSAVHPKTGAPITYSIHFLGAHILDAALQTLRQDGVSPLVYTFGAQRTLPDLDDATEVVLSGDSAGGSGVITNLDRVRDLLTSHNSHCASGPCPLVVRGLADAIVGPDLSRLDFSTSVYFPLGGTSYDLFTQYLAAVPDVTQGAIKDTSCLAWHTAHAPGTEGYCSDSSHVVRHHITTPFFVRMALLDMLISQNYIEAAYSDPELGLLTAGKFALILQRELATFKDLPQTAEEGAAMTVAPGVFAPACPKHDTIHSNLEVFGTTITPDGGAPLALFDVFEPWRAGTTPTNVLTTHANRSDTVCGEP